MAVFLFPPPDLEAPQITCPPDVVVETIERRALANVSWASPRVQDNSGEEVGPRSKGAVGLGRICYLPVSSMVEVQRTLRLAWIDYSTREVVDGLGWL